MPSSLRTRRFHLCPVIIVVGDPTLPESPGCHVGHDLVEHRAHGLRDRRLNRVRPGFCGVGESAELLAATEGVVTRPADLTTDIDADGAVADGADVELGALDVGLELLGQEVAQLLDVEGAQAWKVDGAVGPDREGSAQLWHVHQLHLEAVT